MSKGYICVAQQNENVDYLRLAYGLALSIRNTQSEVNRLSVVTDSDNIPQKYMDEFDQIIKIKNDRAKGKSWKLHNVVDLYDYSPYDETAILDADMLFLNDVSHWWNKLRERSLWFTTTVKNYKDEPIPRETIYRQEFIKNTLPNTYIAFSYFKKSGEAKALFDLTKNITDHWDQYVNQTLGRLKPRVYSTDVAFSLAIKLLGLRDYATMPQLCFPYFTHMKTMAQGWNFSNYKVVEDWTKYTTVDFDQFNNSLGIKIGTIRQSGILHYHVKEFLTDEMIEILER